MVVAVAAEQKGVLAGVSHGRDENLGRLCMS